MEPSGQGRGCARTWLRLLGGGLAFPNARDEAIYCHIHDRLAMENVPRMLALTTPAIAALSVLSMANSQNQHYNIVTWLLSGPLHVAIMVFVLWHFRRAKQQRAKQQRARSCWDSRGMLLVLWLEHVFTVVVITCIWTRDDQMREFSPLNPETDLTGFTGNALALFRLSEMLLFQLGPNFIIALGLRPRYDHIKIGLAGSSIIFLVVATYYFHAYISVVSLMYRIMLFLSMQLMLLICTRSIEQSARAEFRARRGGTEKHEQFLAMFSHELRTPLNGILGMMQVLQSPGMLEPSSAHASSYVQMAINSGRVLLRLVNDMLAFNVMKQTGPQLEVTAFDPRTMLQHVLVLMAGHIEERTGGTIDEQAGGASV